MMDTYTLEVQVDYLVKGLFIEGKCFSCGLFHQQLQGTIRL